LAQGGSVGKRKGKETKGKMRGWQKDRTPISGGRGFLKKRYKTQKRLTPLWKGVVGGKRREY